MKYPAAPVKYTKACQIRGLESGQFMMQPKWDGRRAVKVPGKPLIYKSGKLVDQRPWSNLVIPDVNVVLDIELMRDRAIVIDIMENIPFFQRIQKMNSLGIDHMAMPVRNKSDVNTVLRKCLTSGICDGVVLKRLDSGYPIGLNSQINYEHWIKVKELL